MSGKHFIHNTSLYKRKDMDTEKEYLTKLIEDHWQYIKGVLSHAHHTDYEVTEIGYHYKTAFEHGWKHHKEYTDVR